MPSTRDGVTTRTDVDVPERAASVARSYHRRERLASGAPALVVGTFVAVAFLRMPLLSATIAGVVALAAIRVPVFRTGGTARLATDADPETVRAEFRGPTPPPLAFQWGVADRVRLTDGGGVYELSYLFGLRSAELATEVRSRAAEGGEPTGDFEILVTAGGRPWGTYGVSIRERDGGTELDVEVASDRRFGLRRLPQALLAERYRDDALEAQGYSVLDRDVGLSF